MPQGTLYQLKVEHRNVFVDDEWIAKRNALTKPSQCAE
jgi:hypothetical protein